MVAILTSRQILPSARVPPGQRVYVVGDIHGRDDLLAAMHDLILADAASAGGLERTVVYLGDYIDRGPGSFEVIDLLVNEPLPDFSRVCLKGNHEEMLLQFLHGASGLLWMHNGGDETLASYGIRLGWYEADESVLDQAREQLLAAMPAAHRLFLEHLATAFVAGDYLFVHAGIRPGVPIEEQDERDMMWIRGPFLETKADLGKCVVHGHSISRLPEIRPNRIGIDTGAFFSGRLSCLVLEGTTQRFLQT